MIETTYVCDSCGAKQSTKEQMWSIGIVFRHYDGGKVTDQRSYFVTNIEKLWCRKCLERLGFVPRIEERKTESVPEMSFEDKIREIAREEIEGARNV